MKYIIFGTGDYYERYKRWFRQEDIVALIDNSSKKINTTIDGIEVLSPEQGVERIYDVIVILSFYVKSMRQQLLDLGVPENKIYHFYELHRLLNRKDFHFPIQYYGDAKQILDKWDRNNNKIVLMSQDLTLGGPAIALFHVAVALQNRGYQVVYASMLDGPLREKLLESNISVVVDVNLQIATMCEVEWIRKASLIVCSTINYYVFLSERHVDIPIIWWLHDSQFFYDGVDKKLLRSIDFERIKVVSVGKVPENAIRTIVPELQVDHLLYGVEEANETYDQTKENEKIIFTTIGYIEERKGQDILMDSIRYLPEAIRTQCEFWLVGQDTSLLAQRIKQDAENMPEVVLKGTVDRETINQILIKTDVLICPSREDPMPTVAAEAMMHSTMCLVSDATGTSEYIHHKEDGMVFRSENVVELSAGIAWCVQNKKKLQDMGKKSRKIYETVFSVDVFEKRLMEVIEEANE